jgi:hypothetical protein
MSKTVRVSPRQVESAKILVEISGGLDKVDPYIRKIATAEPDHREHSDDNKAS